MAIMLLQHENVNWIVQLLRRIYIFFFYCLFPLLTIQPPFRLFFFSCTLTSLSVIVVVIKMENDMRSI